MLIHVVDDDEPVRGSLELLLRSVGHQVQTFASASAFLHALDRAAPACLILDLNMPGVDGAELSELLARQGHRFPVIVQTAAPHSPLVERAWRSGVLAVVEKPPSIDRLLELIDRVEGMRRGAAVRPFAESPPRPGVYQTGLQGDSLAELSGCLASLRWPMSGFTHSDACLAAIDRDTPDCIVCDIDTAQGAALARALLAQYSEVPCIALCGDRRSGLAKGLAALERLDGSWMLVDKASPGQLEKSIIQALLSWLGKPPRRLYAAIEPLYPDSDAESLAEQKTSDLVLTPELNVSAMSKNYAQVAMISRYDHLGRNLFEVFPDNPADGDADGASNLNLSLQRALQKRMPDQMRLQRYDIRTRNGTGPFQERWWYPINYPLLRDGKLYGFVHRTEDVTRFVQLRRDRQARRRTDR